MLMKLNFLETFSKNIQIQHLIIVKAELYHADGLVSSTYEMLADMGSHTALRQLWVTCT
jgi:hypothetical protein